MDKVTQILMIDDNEVIRTAALRVLESAGYGVMGAATGAEGFRLVQEIRPTLVLLDRVLPDGDGIEVCRKIKTTPQLSHIFVVQMSAIHTSGDEQAEGLEAGADAYIVRPVGNRQLLAWIKALLRLKRAEDALREEMEKELAERLRSLQHTTAIGNSNGAVTFENLPPIAETVIKDMTGIYYEIVAEYIRTVRIREDRPSEKVQNFARQLASLHVRARDVVQIHLGALERFGKSTTSRKEERALWNDARLVLVELMGNLIDIYLSSPGAVKGQEVSY